MKRKYWQICMAAAEVLESRTLFNVGAAYAAPLSPRVIVNEDASWKFALNPSGTPQSTGFNDAAWGTVSVPHTWDGSATNVQTGDGWYRKSISVPQSMIGNEIYLHFLGASLKATAYIDGVKVGNHNGGWEAFDIDVTTAATAGSHLLAIDVNNNNDSNYVPDFGGDYNKEGGLYRDVSLVAIPKTHVAVTEPVASPDPSGASVSGSGVYFSNSTVVLGASSATVHVKSVLDNLVPAATSVTVTSFLVDAGGVVQAQQASTVALAASQKTVAVNQSASVATPHLWNGRTDAYLYDLYVEIRDSSSNQLLDLSHSQVGIRSFSATANSGFFLNGQSYPLFGVNMHQDSGVAGTNGGQAGWSQSDAQQFQDVDQVLDTGATILRTAHYQRDPAFFNYCDQKGLILETEYGLNSNVPTTTVGSTFVNNAQDMMNETIRQAYNHPSIIFWSLYNEIPTGSSNGALVATMNTLAHNLDSTGRLTVSETHQGSGGDTINSNADVGNPHYYNGWYNSSPASEASQLDGWHSAAPNQPIGVGEFGAGGSAYQYQINPPTTIPNTTQVYHPQNGQTLSSEEQWAAITSRSYVLDVMVWTMFDFTTPYKNEGDYPGTNDKGLMTRDRANKKDIYYFYKANWNKPGSARGFSTQPVVWVSDHNWSDREGPATVTVTAFSNIGAPSLTLNSGAAVIMTQQVSDGLTIPDAYVATITLAAGTNTVQISRSFNGTAYSNSTVWNYHAAALAGTSYARVDFTNSSANLQSGYVADTGEAFSAQGANGAFGWINSAGAPLANTAGTYNRTGTTSAPYDNLSARTGIILIPGSNWQYQLPNGVYDIRVVGADSSTSSLVDNLTLNNQQLQATTFTTSGGTYEAFYATVVVTNGLLTLSAGPGMVLNSGGPVIQGRLASMDINLIAPTTFNGAAGADTYAIRLNPTNGAQAQIFVNTPEGGAPTYSVAVSLLSTLTFAPTGGDGSLTVDFSNGNPLPAGGISYTGGANPSAGGNALYVVGAPAGALAFSISGTQVICTSQGSSAINYANVLKIEFDLAGGANALTQIAQPGAPVNYNAGPGNNTLTVNGGSFTFAADPQASSGSLTVNDNAAVIFNGGAPGSGFNKRQIAAMNLGAGAKATLQNAISHSDRTVLILDSLSITPTATLDMGANDLILHGGDANAIFNLIQSGANMAVGYWDGPGITSTSAQTDAAHLTCIGDMPNNDGGASVYDTFDSFPVVWSDMLVKFTYYGDATLDGVVDGSDYSRIDNGFNTHLGGWGNGDFNHDGSIDGSDYSLIDNAFNTQGASLGNTTSPNGDPIAAPMMAASPAASASDSEISRSLRVWPSAPKVRALGNPQGRPSPGLLADSKQETCGNFDVDDVRFLRRSALHRAAKVAPAIFR